MVGARLGRHSSVPRRSARGNCRRPPLLLVRSTRSDQRLDGQPTAPIPYLPYRPLVELDGKIWHEGLAASLDMERDNRHVLASFTTLRFGWLAVVDNPCRVASHVATALHQGGWTGNPVRCPRWLRTSEAECNRSWTTNRDCTLLGHFIPPCARPPDGAASADEGGPGGCDGRSGTIPQPGTSASRRWPRRAGSSGARRRHPPNR